jgi:hypothetical protein
LLQAITPQETHHMPKISYQVRSPANGAIVGTRKSDRTYTHAIVCTGTGNGMPEGKQYVTTWCGSLDLARKASTQRQYTWNAERVEIVPVEIVTKAPKVTTEMQAGLGWKA